MAETNNAFTPDGTILIDGAETFRTNAIATRNSIIGTDNPDILFGTPGDDDIKALGGDDIIFGTRGNDIVDGGAGFDTIDYTNLGQAITLLPRGVIGGGNGSGGQIINIEKIIGAPGQQNTIDGSSATTSKTSFDINLQANRLVVNNVPNLGKIRFAVENFVNVVGTPNSDKIVGSNADNNLNGFGGDDFLSAGLGNDTVIGGDGNDTLQGSKKSGRRNSSEKDILTGGEGIDKFILGDASGSFYKKAGNDDFAKITDFSFGEQIQLGAGEVYKIQRNSSGFDLFAVRDSLNDLIAQVTIVAGFQKSNARTALGGVDTSLLNTLPEDNFTLASGQTNGIFVGA
jgi:Ca2+-binding RTX toxin-like protein